MREKVNKPKLGEKGEEGNGRMPCVRVHRVTVMMEWDFVVIQTF